MSNMIAIHKWLGRRGEPLDPAAVAFVSRPGATCRGCLFSGQPSAACSTAGEEAARRGIEPCEAGFVYRPPEIDPRQLDLLEQ